MRGWRAVAFVVISSLLLSSCSRQPILILVNHTGHAIDVLRVSLGANRADVMTKSLWETIFRSPARIGDGRSRDLPEALWDPENRYWTVVVQSGPCRLSFVIPFDLGQTYNFNHAWWPWIGQGYHTGDPTVQLEPDGVLYLVSAGAQQAVPLNNFRDIQPVGLPLHPQSPTCPTR